MLLRILMMFALVQVAFWQGGLAQPGTNVPETQTMAVPEKEDTGRIADLGLERKTWTVENQKRSALM